MLTKCVVQSLIPVVYVAVVFGKREYALTCWLCGCEESVKGKPVVYSDRAAVFAIIRIICERFVIVVASATYGVDYFTADFDDVKEVAANVERTVKIYAETIFDVLRL